jgi:hypothetical protein
LIDAGKRVSPSFMRIARKIRQEKEVKMSGVSMRDYLVEVERRKYEMEQAEHYRLLKQLPQVERPRYGRLLASLGAKLVASGRELQRPRFQEECPTPARRPAGAQG